MWVFLWEDGVLREIAAITGAGKRYNFKDLNGDGSLEFVNQEGGVSALVRTEGGFTGVTVGLSL